MTKLTPWENTVLTAFTDVLDDEDETVDKETRRTSGLYEYETISKYLFTEGDWGINSLPDFVTSKFLIEEVESYGGEDMGSSYYHVFKVSDKNSDDFCYLQTDGWYASYDGSYYEESFIVEPREVTKTEYSRK